MAMSLEQIEADRHELARHFFGARATFMKLRGAPAIVRDAVLEAAFNAAADVGIWNRVNGAERGRIEPEAE
jgi:hypothetical protein